MAIEIGEIREGKVTGITKFGAFVELEPGKTGMVHISEVANTFVNEISEFLQEGQAVTVKVLGINEAGKISLSIKKAQPANERPPAPGGRPPQGDAPRFARHSAPRTPPPRYESPGRPDDVQHFVPSKSGSASFEDMMKKFQTNSTEKMSDLKRKSPDSVPRRGGGKRR